MCRVPRNEEFQLLGEVLDLLKELCREEVVREEVSFNDAYEDQELK